MFQGMEYVYEVYKEKSFSKAAANLFISQPSLSANVRRVEARIGYPVFDRSTKPLGLTECGEQYIRCVERIMNIEKDFSDFINDWGGLKTGTLILAAVTYFLRGSFRHLWLILQLFIHRSRSVLWKSPQ